MAAIVDFRPDLAPIKIDDSMKSQVLTGAIQGSDHFYPITKATSRPIEQNAYRM